MLSDTQFLEQYIAAFYLQFEGEIAALKDRDSRYIAATPEFAALLGFADRQDLLQLTDAAVPAATARAAEIFYQQDRLVTEERRELICLDNHYYATGFGVYLFQKKPVINPATNNVIAIRLRGNRPLLLSPLKVAFDMQQAAEQAGSDHLTVGNFASLDVELTYRQHLVLFLTLNNYSQSEISNFFLLLNDQISQAVVKDTLRVLRQKFNVENKEQLVRKALKLGLHTHIPIKLLKEGSFILNGYEVKVKY